MFVSHTSELRDFPRENPYVAAVERAISAAGHVIVGMTDFPAAGQPAAQVCVERVRSCEVYVGILGTRYGSPVRDRPEVSYTELEFDTATEAGLERLVFLLDTDADDVGIPPSALIDREFGGRQDAFRRRVQDSGVLTQSFADPATLGHLVERSLQNHAKTTGASYLDRVAYYGSSFRPASWPLRIGVVPGEADNYQPRLTIKDFDAAMIPDGSAASCHVLSGTGGVGKTQIAAHYARNLWSTERLDLLVWVNAGNRDAIVSAYAHAAEQVTGMNSGDPEQAVSEFLNWLEITDRRWLIVLDDLARPGDLSGLWPPRRAAGHTLVTTRRRDAVLTATDRRLVRVGLFTSKEAAAYLTATLAAHERNDDPEQIRALARELGYLPVALAQAAAYIIDRDLECAEYRRRLADRRRTLVEILPEPSALPDEQRTTVAATWSLSIELANELTPVGLAGPMLELASVLDANGIPITALTSPPALEYARSRQARTSPGRDMAPQSAGGLDEVVAREALHCLHRLNLADFAFDGRERSLRVHGLIQRATRDQFVGDQFDQVVQVAAQALLQSWNDLETRGSGDVLRANADALHASAGPRLWLTGSHVVLFQAGRSLANARLIVSASNYWRQLREAAERYLGPDHLDTLAARNNVADMHGKSGDRAGAVAELELLLADRQRIQGPYHPDTLATRSMIATWREAIGDRERALADLELLLADQHRVLGPDHASTLTTRGRIASMRGESGDRARALAELELLLADRQRIQGSYHPDTLATRGLIATWRALSGDREGALADLELLLADQQRVLGPDHASTLTTRGRIASMRGESGDRARALADLELLLADRQRILGPDHASTLATRSLIADMRARSGDRAGAVAELELLLAEQHRTLGPDHASTLATRATIAHRRAQWGDKAGALADLESLLTDRQRVLGPDHPDTLATQRGVTWLRRGRSPSRTRRRSDAERQATKSPSGYPSNAVFFLRWRAADGTQQTMGPFTSEETAQHAGGWARRGGGTEIEVVMGSNDVNENR